jgi:hypothetical protein
MFIFPSLFLVVAGYCEQPASVSVPTSTLSTRFVPAEESSFPQWAIAIIVFVVVLGSLIALIGKLYLQFH